MKGWEDRLERSRNRRSDDRRGIQYKDRRKRTKKSSKGELSLLKYCTD
jgi:hypothetical protein